MRKWLFALMAALMAVVLVVPAVGAEEPSIIDIAVSDGDTFDDNPGDFDILTEAIIATGLAEALDDDGVDDLPFDVTVFAPTDAAFAKLVKDLTGMRGLSEEEVFGVVASLGLDTVADVILYHVVEGEVFYSTAVTLDGATVPTLLGPTFDIDIRNGKFIVLDDQDPNDRNAHVMNRMADIDASNGVIHAVSEVMRPADL